MVLWVDHLTQYITPFKQFLKIMNLAHLKSSPFLDLQFMLGIKLMFDIRYTPHITSSTLWIELEILYIL